MIAHGRSEAIVVGAGIVVKQAPTDLRVCKGIPITLIVSIGKK